MRFAHPLRYDVKVKRSYISCLRIDLVYTPLNFTFTFNDWLFSLSVVNSVILSVDH